MQLYQYRFKCVKCHEYFNAANVESLPICLSCKSIQVLKKQEQPKLRIGRIGKRIYNIESKHCLYCDLIFTTKREHGKYCSSSCQVQASRKRYRDNHLCE